MMEDQRDFLLEGAQVVQAFEKQLLLGCGDRHCDRKACYTFRKRSSKRPLRPMTRTTARAHALALASQTNYASLLCSSKSNEHAAGSQVPLEVPNMASRPIDHASFEPNLVNRPHIDEFFTLSKQTSIRDHALGSESQVLPMAALPPSLPTVGPMSAAKIWHTNKEKKPLSDMFTDNVEITKPYQYTFFRTLCFLRMRDAVNKADFNFRSATWGVDLFLPKDPRKKEEERDRRRTMLGLLNPSDTTTTLFKAVCRHLTFDLRREFMVMDAFDQLWHTERRLILLPIKTQIVSTGEVGQDYGGVTQEFFHLAIREVFDPAYGLFVVDDTSQMAWFDPRSKEALWKVEMLGLLMALAVHNGFTLPLKFPLVLYEKLQSTAMRQPALERVRDGWPDVYRTLEAILNNDGVEEWSMEYSIHLPTLDGRGVDINMHDPTGPALEELKDRLTRPAIEAGHERPPTPLVTDTNKHQFVSDYVLWLTHYSVQDMFNAFARGFHTCIPASMLDTISASALKGLVEGESTVDAQRLEVSATYEGDFEIDSDTIRDFWKVVSDFDEHHKTKLLEFVTARDRLPMSGSVRFIIDSIGGEDEKLPSSSTCDQRLFLPKYTSIDVMRQKLVYAIDNTQGFQIY